MSADKIKPTHWMDDRQLIVTDEFLNGPRGTSDYRALYNIPGVMKNGKFVRIQEPKK